MQTKLARGVTNALSPHWVAIMVLGGVSYYSSANLAEFAQLSGAKFAPLITLIPLVG